MASSLTEMFAPAIHTQRIEGLLANYGFASDQTLAYFRQRLNEAPKDVSFTLDWVLEHALTRADQDAAIEALTFKTDVLWAQLDALWCGYVQGNIPPGAWRPDEGLLG
jgi:pyrroloquinoline-quinone synthase